MIGEGCFFFSVIVLVITLIVVFPRFLILDLVLCGSVFRPGGGGMYSFFPL